MLTTKLAKKVLTNAEQKHLTGANIRTMAAMGRQVRFMAENPGVHCFACLLIARKLGLETEENHE